MKGKETSGIYDDIPSIEELTKGIPTIDELLQGTDDELIDIGEIDFELPDLDFAKLDELEIPDITAEIPDFEISIPDFDFDIGDD